FYEPVHTRIYDAAQKFMERGLIANPVTMKTQFDADEALKDLGGAAYLAKLAGLASNVVTIIDYARTIYELAISRGLIRLGQEMVEEAFTNQMEVPPSTQIERTEQKLFQLASDGNSDKNFAPIRSALADAIKRAEIARKQQDSINGVPTKFIEMDRMLG